jgi:hypothetical protein
VHCKARGGHVGTAALSASAEGRLVPCTAQKAHIGALVGRLGAPSAILRILARFAPSRASEAVVRMALRVKWHTKVVVGMKRAHPVDMWTVQ